MHVEKQCSSTSSAKTEADGNIVQEKKCTVSSKFYHFGRANSVDLAKPPDWDLYGLQSSAFLYLALKVLKSKSDVTCVHWPNQLTSYDSGILRQ